MERDIATRDYRTILSGVVDLLEEARRSAGRSVNSIMTATYWETGQRIVEFEQQGKGLDEKVWARFWSGKPEPNEEVLSPLANNQDFSDTVWKIRCHCQRSNIPDSVRNFADTVGEIQG